MSGMKIQLDRDLCQGHAVCMSEAPEVFDVNDLGENNQLQNEVDSESDLATKVRLAAQYCPNQAIQLEE